MRKTSNSSKVNCVNGATTTSGGVAHGRGVAGCRQTQTVSKRLHQGRGGATNFRIGTLNVGTLRGKSGEVVETLTRRGIDLCCLQAVRWKGGGTLGQLRARIATINSFGRVIEGA